MPANSEKEHLSIVICGHVDSGKSTTTGRLIFELGGLPERELDKLKQEAERLGKGSFAFAFYMDRQKEERERGVTIACTTKEFYTDKWHYTIIDAPGHRDFIKNMITGASQADVALIMVPADGNFTTAIAKGNHKAGEIQGQTRQHSRLINLLGVKQICIGVNKMDCDTAAYKQARYDEIANEMKSMLVKVGWKKEFIDKNTPVVPISGWMGDNLLKKSDNMGWWKGQEIEYGCGVVSEEASGAMAVLDEPSAEEAALPRPGLAPRAPEAPAPRGRPGRRSLRPASANADTRGGEEPSSSAAGAVAPRLRAKADPCDSHAVACRVVRPAWFNPGLVRLKDVSARRRREIERKLEDEARLSGQPVQSSSRQLSRADDGCGKLQYRVCLTGSVLTSTRERACLDVCQEEAIEALPSVPCPSLETEDKEGSLEAHAPARGSPSASERELAEGERDVGPAVSRAQSHIEREGGGREAASPNASQSLSRSGLKVEEGRSQATSPNPSQPPSVLGRKGEKGRSQAPSPNPSHAASRSGRKGEDGRSQAASSEPSRAPSKRGLEEIVEEAAKRGPEESMEKAANGTASGGPEHEEGEVSQEAGGNEVAERPPSSCPPEHALTLRDEVYVQRCGELHVKANSAVKRLLGACGRSMCFCNLEAISLDSLLLGSRGLVGVLPLFTFASALRCLSLASNGLREGSLRDLAAVLLEPDLLPKLCALDLSNNPLSASCSGSFLQFLSKRPKLLLLGFAGTNINGEHRQRLLRHELNRFGGAEPQEMFEAWRLCKEERRFQDRELWARCRPVLEQQFALEALDEADPRLDADSHTILHPEERSLLETGADSEDLTQLITQLESPLRDLLPTSPAEASEWEAPSSIAPRSALHSPRSLRSACGLEAAGEEDPAVREIEF